MATLDLTLSKMRFPGIENFNPEFGTKETTGRGVHSVSLSENDMMPFLWQRPLSVVENSTTGNIEGDRKLAIEAASVTLTLGRPAYAGCKIDVYGSFQSGTSTVSYDKDASNTATITVGAGEHIELVANASRYFEPKAPALAEVVAASGTLSQAKTIPLGYTAESRLAFKVVFPAGHNDGTSSDGLTLNGIPVVSNQNGTLLPIPHHEMTEGGSTVYKVLDANTVLELYYTADYDGSQNPAFVVVGNPLVLSSSTYSIYANGNVDSDYLSDFEQVTISTNSASPTVIDKDGMLFISSPYEGDLEVTINGVTLPRIVYSVTAGGTSVSHQGTILVQKGDEVYYIKGGTGTVSIYARWYEYRNL